jgi:ABC-type glycerol-3-phosphate transport system permease component
MSAPLTEPTERTERGAAAHGCRRAGPGRRPADRRRVVRRTAGYLLLILLGAATAFPFGWLLATSLRNKDTVFTGPAIPTHLTFDAYRRAWTQLDFLSHFLTTLVVTALTVALVVLLATLAGYSFAKLRFPGRQAIYVVLLSTLMLPAAAVIIPLFLELKDMSLLNTRQGLVLVYVGTSLPFAMFLMRAFFETLPDELVHAARVDGAGEFTVFWRIMLPLAAPGVATVVIFQFLATWNEYLFAQTLIQTPGRLSLQPTLFTLVGQYSTEWPLLCAALVMSILPIIVVYVRMQRRFVAGMTLGAVQN